MSWSGNTKKIAEAIFGEIEEEKEIREYEEVSSLEGYGFAFVGFPMHGFGAPDDIKPFFRQHCQGKTIALFVTHGAPEHSPELPPWLEKCRAAASGANVVDMFNCQGELASDVVEALLNSDDPRHRTYGAHAATTAGQPDATRMEWARKFAKEVMKRVQLRSPRSSAGSWS
jgi:flavodoxin